MNGAKVASERKSIRKKLLPKSYISENNWTRHQKWVLNRRFLRKLNCEPIFEQVNRRLRAFYKCSKKIVAKFWKREGGGRKISLLNRLPPPPPPNPKILSKPRPHPFHCFGRRPKKVSPICACRQTGWRRGKHLGPGVSPASNRKVERLIVKKITKKCSWLKG